MHPLAVEDHPRPRRFEELRQRSGRPEGERLPVEGDGPLRVLEAVAPNLQRAERRHPVLDVIEGAAEEMRLLVPARDSLAVEPAPVDTTTLESTPQVEPLLVSRIGIAPGRVEVDPVLESVHRCAVRKEEDDALEQFGARTAGLLL